MNKRTVLSRAALVALLASLTLSSASARQAPEDPPAPPVAPTTQEVPDPSATPAAAPDEPHPSPDTPHADPGEVVAAGKDIHGDPIVAHGDDHHGESIWSFLARLANFALLAGGLYYVLGGVVSKYIAGRQSDIRADLALASDMRADAARRLAAIEAQLQGLPAELELVKQRGAEEVAAEEQRILERAEIERSRLIAQVEREIAQQTRTARQELREHAAALAVGVAAERLRQTLTPEEQRRLAEQYISGVGDAS